MPGITLLMKTEITMHGVTNVYKLESAWTQVDSPPSTFLFVAVKATVSKYKLILRILLSEYEAVNVSSM